MDDDNSREVPKHEKYEFQPKENPYCICVFVIDEGEKLIKQLKSMKPFKDEIDVVVADGGSTDGSTEHEKLKALGVNTLLVKKDTGGLGSQMRMAFAWALSRQYEGVVVIDGNGKDSVESITDFKRSLDQGYDHIQGSRFIEGGVSENLPFVRWLGVKLFHVPLMRLASGFKYTDTTNGFRAYSAKLLQDTSIAIFRSEFKGYELHYYLAKEAARRQYRLVEVPVERRYPLKGAIPTKISPIKGNANVVQKLVSVCLGKYDSDRSEALPILSKSKSHQFSPSVILLSMMMFAVTLILWFDGRFSMNPDGMAYMDIALEYANGNWSNALNSSWPPLYSWLLIPIMKADLNPAYLFPAINFVNVVVMALVLIAFHFMLSEMILLKNSISKKPLNDLVFRLIAYGLMFTTVIQTRVVILNTPDLLQCPFLFMMIAHLIRLYTRDLKISDILLLGLYSGFAYYAKSIFFFMTPLLLISTLFVIKIRRGHISREHWFGVLSSFLLSMVICSPYIALISIQQNRFTISDSGKINYGMFVTKNNYRYRPENIDPQTGVMMIEQSAPGEHYPVHVDRVRWEYPHNNTVDIRRHLSNLLKQAKSLFGIFMQDYCVYVLFALSLMVFQYLGAQSYCLSVKRFLLLASLIFPLLGVMGAYIQIFVLPRYVGMFIVVALLLYFAFVQVPKLKSTYYDNILKCGMIFVFALLILTGIIGILKKVRLSRHDFHLDIAKTVNDTYRGSKDLLDICIVGGSQKNSEYPPAKECWVFYVPTKISAIIPDGNEFLKKNRQSKEGVYQHLSDHGIDGVVFLMTSKEEVSNDWIPLKNQRYLYWLE